MIRIFWIVFTFIKQYYKFRDSNIPMGEIFMNIFLFTAQTRVVWGSGSPPRGLKFIFLSNYGNVHLIVHPSEIKLRHSPNQISKSSFSSWCWMTFTAVTVLVGRVLSWLQSPHAFELFSHLPHRQSHHHRQDRKCVKNVFPLATFPRVYSFAPRRR